MKIAYTLATIYSLLFVACSHNAPPPEEKITKHDIVQAPSVIFIPITASNRALSTFLQSKIPDPLVNDRKNIPIPIFNPVTTPTLITTTILVDGTCDVLQRVRVSWKCLFCPSCCFALVTVQQACKIPQTVTKWINETIIKKATVDMPIEYLARINNINIDGNNDTLHLHLTIDFQLKGEVPIAHVGIASCGYGEPMPQIELDLSAKTKLADDGQILLENKTWGLKWNKPCNLTAMDINVEDLMHLPVIKDMIQKKLDDILQTKIPNNFSLKDQLAKKWDLISKPYPFEGLGYLNLNIAELSARNIFVSNDLISTQIGAICNPVFNITDDSIPTQVPPLPKLTVKNGNDSFNITVLAELNLDKLSKFGTEELKKNNDKLNKKGLKINDVRFYQHGDTLVTEVGLTKPFRGKVYLSCQPGFDLANNMVSFGRFTFYTDSKNVIAKYGAQLLNEPLIQDALSSIVKYKFNKNLSTAIDKIRNTNKQISDNLYLKVKLDAVSPTQIHLSDSKLIVTANAKGQAIMEFQ